MTAKTTTAKTTTATAAPIQHITVNIGPGPNSIAALRLEGPPLTEREIDFLKDTLEDEADDTLQTLSVWLDVTRDVDMSLWGAHHEIESVEDDEGHEQTLCVFCGRHYRWRVRCPGNREGLV